MCSGSSSFLVAPKESDFDDCSTPCDQVLVETTTKLPSTTMVDSTTLAVTTTAAPTTTEEPSTTTTAFWDCAGVNGNGVVAGKHHCSKEGNGQNKGSACMKSKLWLSELGANNPGAYQSCDYLPDF